MSNDQRNTVIGKVRRMLRNGPMDKNLVVQALAQLEDDTKVLADKDNVIATLNARIIERNKRG